MSTSKFNTRRRKHVNGGILKAQEGTGNLYAPHPLSPVGIALNQAKAMAKGKTHLPPGVKEMIGPDGQKIAIRIEQPLQPLEQSIAEWLPGTGDVAEVGYIADDLKEGRYGTAALAAGLLVLPGSWGKFVKRKPKLRDAEWYMRVRDGKSPIDDLLEYQEYQRTGNTRLLDKTYNGELVVSPKVGLERRVNTLTDRQKFIREHPVLNYNGPTDAPMTIEDALEEAGQFRAKYQHQLDEAIGDIKYDSKLSDGILGHTEGTSLGYMYYGRGPRRKANIRVSHAQGSNDTMDAITDLHELHHATGNSDDGYIYNYLKENGIVDWNSVAPYYKDSDRGEIGAHLSELPDYLGFTKKPGKRYQTAYGKRTINEEDIKNFMRFNEQRGFRQDHTIWGNIKNMKAFLDFINKHKFAIAAPTIGVVTTLSNNSKTNELQ